ncbi:MAG: hypothetical protein IPK19_13085 [Chloroflexi bacterium]|nr:hypothetical protein [Chloroflexota bacterium]
MLSRLHPAGGIRRPALRRRALDGHHAALSGGQPLQALPARAGIQRPVLRHPPYILNHWYQAAGSPTVARQRGQVNAREGGWYFEYPYDPLQQSHDPGRTVYGGTALTPRGDPVGPDRHGAHIQRAQRQMVRLAGRAGAGHGGGIFLRDQVYHRDTRYPAYGEFSLPGARKSPCSSGSRGRPAVDVQRHLWKEDEYYLPSGGMVRAVDQLGDTPPVLRTCRLSRSWAPASWCRPCPVPGPGPIHGAADFHMVILALGLDSSWFFETARAYWELFHPMVTTQTDLVDFIPGSQSLAVTIIAPAEMVDTMRRAIAENTATSTSIWCWPTAWSV